MKKLAAAIVLLIAMVSSAEFAGGRHYTRGYWRDTDRDGVKDSYVAPHYQTNPDRSPYNNYGYPGNYNPNSGDYTRGSQERYLDRYYNNRTR